MPTTTTTYRYSKDDMGCYIDGALGRAHMRARLADLIRPIAKLNPDELKILGWLGEALDADVDGIYEEECAIDLLNEHTDPTLVFELEAGDLLLRRRPMDELTITSIKQPSGRKIEYVEDSYDGNFYLYSHESGPSILVRAGSWERAFYAAQETLPPVSDDEIHEAYGCDSAEELHALCQGGDTPELAEGYAYADGVGGSGVVWTGYDEALADVDLDALIGCGWTIELEPHM